MFKTFKVCSWWEVSEGCQKMHFRGIAWWTTCVNSMNQRAFSSRMLSTSGVILNDLETVFWWIVSSSHYRSDGPPVGLSCSSSTHRVPSPCCLYKRVFLVLSLMRNRSLRLSDVPSMTGAASTVFFLQKMRWKINKKCQKRASLKSAWPLNLKGQHIVLKIKKCQRSLRSSSKTMYCSRIY